MSVVNSQLDKLLKGKDREGEGMGEGLELDERVARDVRGRIDE